jgi:hypothetical protein
MTSVLFMNGLFDIADPVLHWPLFSWGWIALWIFSSLAYAFFHFGKWKAFGPLQGLYYAYKDGSNAAFIFDASLIGEFVPERSAKCIFDYSKWNYELEGISGWFRKKVFYYPTAFLDDIDFLHSLVYKFGKVNKDVQIARKLEGGDWERFPSVVCGGVPVDIVVDTDNWTLRNTRQHKAIEREVLAWNERPENKGVDEVHSYSKFQRYLLQGKIVCPELKKDHPVSWTRINAGFTTDMEATEYTGKILQMSEQQYNEEQISKNKLGWGVLLGGIGFAVLVLVVRLITHFVK